MTPAARLSAAVELLASVEVAPRKPGDAVANDFFRQRRYIGSGDRRAVSDRAWAVLRTRRRLHWWLARAGLAPTPRLLVAASLLTGGWSLEGVEQSFSGGQYAPTALSAEEKRGLRSLAGHTLDHPGMPEAVRLEIPDWMLSALTARFGTNLAAELEALGAPAPLDLRVNLLRASRDEARAALARENIGAEPTPISPWGLRVDGRRPVSGGAAFRDGLVEIQDEGSQVIALLVGAAPGMRVLDWCAGAGGKTLALAMAMGNQGHIAACDVNPHRLDGAIKRLRRAGVHNVERHLITPGDKWAKRRAGTFDRVLVDAPCSGCGTWRRNPDARLRLRPQDVAELAMKQQSILLDASRLVRGGGRLIYATCSLLPAENEAQVDTFLAAHPEFRLLKLPDAWNGPGAPPTAEDTLSLSPLRHGTDGFFAAVLERLA